MESRTGRARSGSVSKTLRCRARLRNHDDDTMRHDVMQLAGDAGLLLSQCRLGPLRLLPAQLRRLIVQQGRPRTAEPDSVAQQPGGAYGEQIIDEVVVERAWVGDENGNRTECQYRRCPA